MRYLDNDDNDEFQEPVVTRKEALHSLKNLKLRYEKCEDLPPNFFSMLNDRRRLTENNLNSAVQQKIICYFHQSVRRYATRVRSQK